MSANTDALRMLGADPPALGRLMDDITDFSPSGSVSAVVISDALWRRRFDADPSVVGRPIELPASFERLLAEAERDLGPR